MRTKPASNAAVRVRTCGEPVTPITLTSPSAQGRPVSPRLGGSRSPSSAYSLRPTVYGLQPPVSNLASRISNQPPLSLFPLLSSLFKHIALLLAGGLYTSEFSARVRGLTALPAPGQSEARARQAGAALSNLWLSDIRLWTFDLGPYRHVSPS